MKNFLWKWKKISKKNDATYLIQSLKNICLKQLEYVNHFFSNVNIMTSKYRTSISIEGLCVCSGMSNSLQSHGLWPINLLCPWNFPGQNTGAGCHFLLQRIFPTQGQNMHLFVSCIAGGFFTTSATWKAQLNV